MSVYEKLMAVANDPHATPAERAAYRAKAERIAGRAAKRGFTVDGGKLARFGPDLVRHKSSDFGYHVPFYCTSATESVYAVVASMSRSESGLVPV